MRARSPAEFRTRVDSFVGELDRLAADRRMLGRGLATSALGWLIQAAILWLSLSAVDVRATLVVPVVVVTVVAVTDLAPFPGGLGTVDAALVVLLVATTGIPAATATAAALLFRTGILLLPIVLGGVVVAAMHVRLGRTG